ncbi:MAG: HAD family hydrolase [Acutalibacteraceae bacterium]
MRKIKTIVWDWNGTLLNDVDLNINIVNKMLTEFNIQTISKDYYRCIFSFPIFAFYKKLGFKIDDNISLYEKLVEKYNKMYCEQLLSGSLFPNAEHMLQHLHKFNVQHIILSGQNQKDLDYQVDHFGIREYFCLVKGSEEKDASDKKYQLSNIVQYQNLSPQDMLIIGDTISDWELASTCGSSCILFTHGHQDEKILSQTPAKLFSGFSQDFFDFLLTKLY